MKYFHSVFIMSHSVFSHLRTVQEDVIFALVRSSACIYLLMLNNKHRVTTFVRSVMTNIFFLSKPH